MSADNGIYILKTKHPTDEGKSEFRVIHAQAIENIYWNAELGKEIYGEIVPEEAASYFGQAEVFVDEFTAEMIASELADNYDYLEYGISTLDHSDWVFQHFTGEDLKKYFQRVDELMEKHRKERDAELKAAREAATIHLDAGTIIKPHTIHARVTSPDGELELNGSLSGPGVEKIIIGEGGAKFLPFSWSDGVD